MNEILKTYERNNAVSKIVACGKWMQTLETGWNILLKRESTLDTGWKK